jgi:gliding motility-associated transport system ATP-binding protein
MIEARRLTRRFGGHTAVDDVSFAVAAGEVVGFLGPNGAGKTTTMRMLLGLLRPDDGDASIEGPAGFLPEVFAGYDQISVCRYLRFMAAMKRVDRAAVDRAARAAHVEELSRRPLGRLSKGQRQRVGIAQALLGEPGAYVFDEPTQGLDPKQVVDARRLLRHLADQGAAVLLSTHLLAEAAAVCDRVVVIVGGRVVAEERPGETADLEARFLRLVGEAELQ